MEKEDWKWKEGLPHLSLPHLFTIQLHLPCLHSYKSVSTATSSTQPVTHLIYTVLPTHSSLHFPHTALYTLPSHTALYTLPSHIALYRVSLVAAALSYSSLTLTHTSTPSTYSLLTHSFTQYTDKLWTITCYIFRADLFSNTR